MELFEFLIIVLLIVVLFFPKKLPDLAESLGRSTRAFRKALRGDSNRKAP